jgi:hypothetical protein
MGIHVKRLVLVFDNVSMIAFEPEYNRPSEENLDEYMKHNPMPHDPKYSPEDLKSDLLIGTGFMELPVDVNDETMFYVRCLISDICSNG